jgi:HPt (histidine-containing phosphotransfer) domain-containing protein
MTAHALAGYRDECLEAGMNDYVAKPIDPVHLLAVLQTWIPAQPHEARRGPGTSDLAGAPAGPPPGDPEETSAFDVPEALGRLRGNQGLYLDLLGDFARDFAGAATPIREALAQGAWDAAADLAHRIRGLAGNLSANALMRAAGDLEMAASAGDGAAARAALGPLEAELARALTEARERAAERPVRPDPAASPAMPEGAPTSLLEALDRQLLLGEPDAVRTLEALTLLLAPGLRAEAESLRTLVASFAFPEARIRLQKLRAGLEGA